MANGDEAEAINAAQSLVAHLYDPSESYKSLHSDLNQLRTKLACNKEKPMAKLPPSEPVFMHHVC